MFNKCALGRLINITGQDAIFGAWQHQAFVPNPCGPTASAPS